MFRRILSVVLCVFMVASSVIPQKNQMVYAYNPDVPETQPVSVEDPIEKYPTTTDADFNSSLVDIESELIDERTATSKTYRKIDGTYEYVAYDEVVHYLDAGIWKEIDNSMVDVGNEVQNKANAFMVNFPKAFDSNQKIKVQFGDFSISWKMLKAKTSFIEYNANSKTSSDVRNLSSINQRVFYSEVQPNVDIEYIVSGEQIKENVILNKYIENYSISFEYSLKNLFLSYDDKDNIVFVDEAGNVISYLSSIIMFDAEQNESSEIELRFVETGNKTYIVTVTPNANWMRTAKYPVTIDPSLTFYGDSDIITDKYVYGSYSSTTTVDYNKIGLYSTYHYRSYLEFDLTQIPSNIMVNYAYLRIDTYPNKNNCTNGCTILAKEVLPTYTLSSIDREGMSITDDRVIDYEEVLLADGDDVTYQWDLSRNFQKWLFNGDTSRIIELRKEIETETGYIWLQSENYNMITGPVLTIGYDDSNGLHNYWTYNEQPISTAGTGYVSDYTGKLTLIRTDFNLETEKQSLGLSLVYNLNNRLTNIGYGAGWRTSYNIEARLDPSNNKYYSIDATGAKTYYVPTECDSRYVDNALEDYSAYLAEDGSRNLFITLAERGTGEIIDYFLVTLEQVTYHFGYDGYLDTIQDKKTGSTLTIDYDIIGSNVQIDQITDSTGNYIDLNYNAYGDLSYGYLYVKTGDPSNPYDLLEKISYSYVFESTVGDYVPRYVYFYRDYVDDEVFTQDNYAYYDHDSAGRLLIAQSTLGPKVTYSYNAVTDKVSMIQTYLDSSKTGEVTYEYDFKSTTITNYEGSQVLYWFDNYGHTIQIMSDEGFVQTFKYLNIFSLSGYFDTYIDINHTRNYRLNHVQIYQSSPEFAFLDPILNGGFEEYASHVGDPNWAFYVDDYNGLPSYYIDDTYSGDESVFGDYSAFASVGEGQAVHYAQSITLDAGTYNVSGFIKLNGSTSSAYIVVNGATYNVNDIEYASPNLGWQYVDLPFTVTSDNTTVSINLHLCDTGSGGSAFFDSIQLLEGYRDTRTNLMGNPSFENALSGWTMSNANVARIESSAFMTSPYGDILGDYSIRILGDNATNRYASTDISSLLDMTSNQVYTVKVWSKSFGTPMKIWNSLDERIYRLKIEYTKSTGTVYDYINFDPSAEEWQLLTKEIIVNATISAVHIYLEYRGLGSVLFDGLTVESGLSGEYIEVSTSGNIVRRIQSNKEQTHYEYLVDDEGLETEKPLDSRAVSMTGEHNDTSVPIDTSGRPTYFENNNVRITPTYNTNGQVTQMRYGDATIFFTTSTVFASGKFNQYKQSTTNEFGYSTYYDNNLITTLLDSITNANGDTVEYQYYDDGLLHKVLNTDYCDAANPSSCAVTEYVYNADNMLIKIILSSGYYYQIAYNAQNRMSSVSVKNDSVAYSNTLMSYTYVYENTVYTSKIDVQTYGNDDFIQFVYDEHDRVASIKYNNSLGVAKIRFSYAYDQMGRVAVYNTHEGDTETITRTEYYTYNSEGKLIGVADNIGNRISYGYDQSGNMTQLEFDINGKTQETIYFYNKYLDYVGTEDDIQSSLYDKTTYETQDDQSVTKEYFYENNALYRLDYIKLLNGTFAITNDFVYTGNTTRIYEVIYNIDKTSDGTTDTSVKYRYQYDSLGNIASVYYYLGTTLKTYEHFEYDELNQLKVVDSRDYDYNAATLNATNYTKYYYYDLRGNLTDIKTFFYGQDDTTPPVQPAFYFQNNGAYEADMVYNGTQDYMDVYNLNLGQTPSLSFVYYDKWDFDHEYPLFGMTTTMTYSNLNTAVAGYYYRIYEATDGYNYDLTFRIVFKVGSPLPTATTPQAHIHYVYQTTWLDQLAETETITYNVDGSVASVTTAHHFDYDDQGNPTRIDQFYFDGTTYHHAKLDYQGRQLMEIRIYNAETETSQSLVDTITYKYNDQGYRTSMTVGEVTTTYSLQDDKVLFESDGTYGIIFTYDYDGKLIGFNYDSNVNDTTSGIEYYYLRNQQGDITKIVDKNGNIVVEYYYDAWGNITKTSDTSGNNLAIHNPYRYRGYRYDQLTSLYYLNSRYYFPEIGRFLNSDGLLGQSGDTLSANMYAYCANNPVMYSDPTGEFFVLTCIVIGAIIGGLITYNLAKNAGYEGADLILLTLLGAAGGGIAGYLAAPFIASFLGTTFTFGGAGGIGISASGVATMGVTATISVTGAQLVVMGGTIALSGYLFARTSKSNGYWGEKYPNDHAPDHIHIKGPDGTNIRIDQSGNPLRGEGPLTPQIRRVIGNLWEEIQILFELWK